MDPPLPHTPLLHGKQEPLNPQDQKDEQRHCKCKYSKCLQLYCECFESGSLCNGCNCLNCHNNSENESERLKAIKGIVGRKPDAFKPKIASNLHGCHCKRSGCLKKYCVCYDANVLCSEKCRCEDCKNIEGTEERNRPPQVSETNAAIDRAICYLKPSEPRKRRRRKDSHSVASRGSSEASQLVQNQMVNIEITEGNTSLFTIPHNTAVSKSTALPSNIAVSKSTAPAYRSSLANTIQPHHIEELCSLLVSRSMDVAKNFSEERKKCDKDPALDPAKRDANEINDSSDAIRMQEEKPLSPVTRALMCDEEPMITPEEDKEDGGTYSEMYEEQEKQALTGFRDYIIQFMNKYQ